MVLTNENRTCFYKVHRFILEKINPWIQDVNWTWIRRSEGVFRKSFDRVTNFQFTLSTQGNLRPVSSWNFITFMLFITITKTNHLTSCGKKHRYWYRYCLLQSTSSRTISFCQLSLPCSELNSTNTDLWVAST